MRRVFSRGSLIFAFVTLLLVAVSAFADDPEIQPPLPHAVSPVTHNTFWQIVRIVLFKV